jgi:CheY-like chemotaxis protein
MRVERAMSGSPDVSGHEVCRRLRARSSGRELTIVAVTGWGQKADRLRIVGAGFDRHLVSRRSEPPEWWSSEGHRTRLISADGGASTRPRSSVVLPRAVPALHPG